MSRGRRTTVLAASVRASAGDIAAEGTRRRSKCSFFVLVVVTVSSLFQAPALASHDGIVDRSGRELLELVSLSSAGVAGNGNSGWEPGIGTSCYGRWDIPAISSGGRYVAFSSAAAGLHPDDSNGRLFTDVFVRDVTGSDTEVVSSMKGPLPPLPPDLGVGACTNMSFNPHLSRNGRYVAFASRLPLTGLSDVDRADMFSWKVFLKDRTTGRLELVSRSEGRQVAMGGHSGYNTVKVSDDGQRVLFDNTDATFSNGQLYVFDLAKREVTLVSKSSAGTAADGNTTKASLSGNGRFVAFESTATNLAANDLNTCPHRGGAPGCFDVFLHDLQKKETELVSVGIDGVSGNEASWLGGCCHEEAPGQVVSRDGRYVVFTSNAEVVPAGGGGLFVRDLRTQRTERVGVNGWGKPVTFAGAWGQISDDGRYVSWLGSAQYTCGMLPCSALGRETTHGYTGQMIFDRKIGQMSFVSARESTNIAEAMEPGDTARRSVLLTDQRSDARDGNEWDIYLRDLRRIPRGVGELAPGVQIRHRGAIARDSRVTVLPADADGTPGADIISHAVLAYRPESRDLYLRIDIRRAAKRVSLPAAVYGASFNTGGTHYEVRAVVPTGRSDDHPLARYSLYRCETGCEVVTRLRGSHGTVGDSVVVSVPIEAVTSGSEAVLSNIEVFSDLMPQPIAPANLRGL